jgi:glycosyltransferase involved in cell wall biosynthesis
MNTPKVSIILMTYNQGKYLHTAIQSALSQTYENIEILISNNGSSDDTTNIVQSFLPNKKITYLDYPKNESVNLRANQAIDLASGDFISWLYGDDYYLDEKIQTQILAFNSLDKSYGVVYGPGYIYHVSDGKKVISSTLNYSGHCLEKFLARWVKDGAINPISSLVRKDCYKYHRPDNAIFTEGEVLYLHLAVSYKFFYLDKPLVVMTDHESNLGKQVERNLSTHIHSILRLLKENDLPKKIENLAYSHICELKVIDCWHCIRTDRNITWAKSLLKSAFSTSSLHCMVNKYFFASLVLLFLPKKLQKVVNNLLPDLQGQDQKL